VNLNNKFQSALSGIKSLEGQFKDRVEAGSKNPLDYHYFSYFSGVRNGFNFVWHVLDNHLTEQEFDELFGDLTKADMSTEEK
jgi:hypothetical protein